VLFSACNRGLAGSGCAQSMLLRLLSSVALN